MTEKGKRRTQRATEASAEYPRRVIQRELGCLPGVKNSPRGFREFISGVFLRNLLVYYL